MGRNFLAACVAGAGCAAMFSSGCGVVDDILGGGALVYDFRDGAQGWQVVLADYDVDQEQDIDPVVAIRSLPSELGVDGTGLRVAGDNVSDDLIMLLYRELGETDGIQPNTDYEVSFWIVVASNAPSDCAGIGGAPGEGVTLKAGAAGVLPVAAEDAEGVVRLNIDFGNQTQSGENASSLGSIANGVPCDAIDDLDESEYVSLVRTHEHREVIRSSADGRLWILVGTDSGFEGRTDLFYERIEVTVDEAN